MRIHLEVGDVLAAPADVLLCTANPYLRMTGGVNGALLQAGGAGIQEQLRAHLRRLGRTWVPRGHVARTGPGPLGVAHVLHVVAVDGFYKADVASTAEVLAEALRRAAELGARRVATPALATGYGPLTMEDFGRALGALAGGVFEPLEELRVVLRKADRAAAVSRGLGLPAPARAAS